MDASGSINFPKLDTRLNFLAIKPSAMSVIPDIVNIINAAIKFPLNIQATINGISKNLIIVRVFGTCFNIIPPLINIKF